MSKSLNTIIGQKYGKLTVVNVLKDVNNKTVCECLCECGNKKIIAKSSLEHDYTKSCGCQWHLPRGKDLSGQKINKLTVIERIEHRSSSGRSRPKYRCVCECGNEAIVPAENLTNGKTISCGCVKGKNAEDLIGKSFNCLTVIKQVDNIGKKVAWECECKCGNKTIVTTSNLKSGQVKSCGCMKNIWVSEATSTHDETSTRLYKEWSGIKRRCYNPNDKAYTYYGAKGIVMCDEWKNNYIAFRDWAITHGYSDKLTIDRINVYEGYEPNNCRWATKEQQANNMTTNVKINFEGVTHTISEWAQLFGVNPGTSYSRRKKGWADKHIFDPPCGKTNNNNKNIDSTYYEDVLLPIILKEKNKSA